MLEAEKAGEISKVEDPEGGNGVYYSHAGALLFFKFCGLQPDQGGRRRAG